MLSHERQDFAHDVHERSSLRCHSLEGPALQRMKNFLLAIPLLTACVADEAQFDETSSEITKIGGPTTLTFYQHGSFVGTSHTVTLGSTDDFERLRLVPISEIAAADLENRISAVRLRCGDRAARVVIFERKNQGSETFSTWDHLSNGDGRTISCQPYQTTTVQLGTVEPELNDNVGSALLVTHARAVDHFNFTDFFESAWATALDQLPSEATPNGTDIWLTSTRSFSIRQRLKIDHWACTERGAVFEYSVRLMTDNTFRATVTDSYVDYGLGDLWDCRDKMKATLDSALAGARDDLEESLETAIDFLAPDHPRYYFVPDQGLRWFDMFYGADPIENAPL